MADNEGQKKSERLHMLISPIELEAIDDWRFKNRIGTRAEAVRRLTQAALDVEQPFEKFSKHIHELYAELMTRLQTWETGPMAKKPPDQELALKMAVSTVSDLLKEFGPLMVEVNAVEQQLAKLRGNGNIIDIEKQTAAIKAEAKQRAKMLRFMMSQGEGEDEE